MSGVLAEGAGCEGGGWEWRGGGRQVNSCRFKQQNMQGGKAKALSQRKELPETNGGMILECHFWIWNYCQNARLI